MNILRKHTGHCPICEADTIFLAEHEWLRDHYFCIECRSIPRQRALIRALNKFVPDWRSLKMHESSPGSAASSRILKERCHEYSCSYCFHSIPRGIYSEKHQAFSQDLEEMTFSEATFDVFITQDVMEHVMHPEKALREISRVLKPGGAHVFTVPWYPNNLSSELRAMQVNGKVHHMKPADYHGNPIDKDGSLVTVDWGLNLPEIIFQYSGMMTTVYVERDSYFGLDGDFLEVFISRKPKPDRISLS